MKKVRMPDYIVTTYLLSQREVTEALGLKFSNKIVRIYCDGDNKVRIDVMEGVK